MSKPRPNFLDVMPGELRICTYQKLLEGFTGDTSALEGGLLSCKQLHIEISYELYEAFLFTLDTAISEMQAEWNLVCQSPLRVTRQGSALDDMEVTVEIPMSYFRDTKDYSQDPFKEQDEGLGRFCEVLGPLLAFKLAKLTCVITLDEAMLPRQPDDEPTFYAVLEDLASLVCAGCLYQFSNSVPGREDVKYDVKIKQMVFDWSAMRADDVQVWDNNANVVIEGATSDDWDIIFDLENGLTQSGIERYEVSITPIAYDQLINRPFRVTWIRQAVSSLPF